MDAFVKSLISVTLRQLKQSKKDFKDFSIHLNLPKRQSGKLVSLIDFSLGLVTCLGEAMYPSTTKVHNVKVLKAFN